MPRNFDGSGDRLSVDAVTPTWNVPLTYGIWGSCPTTSGDNAAFGTGQALGNANHRFASKWSGNVGGDPLRFVADAGGTANQVATSTGYSLGVYALCCCVAHAVDDRDVYIDGGSKGTTTTSRTLNAQAAISVAAQVNGVEDYEGDLGIIAMWDRDFNDEEVLALAKGVHPWRMSPQNIIAFWPMYAFDTNEQDWGPNGFELAPTDTPVQVDGGPPVAPMRTRRAAA